MAKRERVGKGKGNEMKFRNNIPNPNVGATLAVALNPNTNKHGANTATKNATTHAQGDREGRPYGTDITVANPAIWTTVFVIIHNSIVETDNYPSLLNNNLTKGGYL